MTAIPTWIGVTMIFTYWSVMAGMVINAYVHYNVEHETTNHEKIIPIDVGSVPPPTR